MGLQRALLLCGLCAALGFWAVEYRSRALVAQLSSLRRASPAPIVMNGFRIALDSYLNERLPADSSVSRYVVFVSSDQCGYSQAQLPIWQETLKRMSFTPEDEILFISLSGDGIPHALRSIAEGRHARFLTRTVTSSAGFGHDTGISWTPEAMILDSRMKVLAATSEITRATIDAFVKVFTSFGVQSQLMKES